MPHIRPAAIVAVSIVCLLVGCVISFVAGACWGEFDVYLRLISDQKAAIEALARRYPTMQKLEIEEDSAGAAFLAGTVDDESQKAEILDELTHEFGRRYVVRWGSRVKVKGQ